MAKKEKTRMITLYKGRGKKTVTLEDWKKGKQSKAVEVKDDNPVSLKREDSGNKDRKA